MKTLLASACLLLFMAACSQGTAPQQGATPIDVAAEADRFFQQNPDAVAASLLNARGKGFEIYEDGKTFYVSFGAKTDVRTRTGVSSMAGNEICFREQRGWSGACMDLFRNPDGTFFASGRFGNGATFRETFVLRPVFAP